jgi:trigger factor
MDIKKEKISDTQIDVLVHVTPEEVREVTEGIVKTLMKTVQVKGYRKGHVPPAVISGLYKQDILAQATSQLVQTATTEAFKDRDLKSAMNPRLMEEFSPTKNKKFLGVFDLDGSLRFGISADVIGEIDIGDLSSISVQLDAMEKDEWLDSQMKEQSFLFGARELSDKPCVTGDEVICEYEAVDLESGEVIGSDAYARIVVGSGNMPKELEDSLVGLEQDAFFDIDASFPPFHFKSDFAGKRLKIRGKIVEVSSVSPHEINEELASLAGYSSLTEMREAQEAIWKEQYEEGLKANKLSLAINKILEKTPIAVPDTLIENELKSLKIKMNLDYDIDMMRKVLSDIAIKNVQTALILEAVYSSAPEIHLTADELLSVANEEAIRRSMGDGAYLLELLRKTGQYEAFVAFFEQRKAADYLVKTVKYTK